MTGAVSSMMHPGQMPHHRQGRHIGKWPVIIAGIFATVIMLGIIYGGIHRLSAKNAGGPSENEAPSIASTGDELQEYLGNQQEGFIDSKETVNLQIQNEPPKTEKAKPPPRPQIPEISAAEKALLAYREQQIKLYLSALTADTDINAGTPQSSVKSTRRTPPGISQTPFSGAASNSANNPLARLNTIGQDPNKQDNKLAFLNREPSTTQYVGSGRQDQLVEYEIKTGSVIPAVMISGLNSDLPGQVIGQVAQNVYDTATGRYLLIPQGTRIYGDYDSKVSYGQNRALVVWSRLIYPDGSTQALEGMQGMDQGGYAGFKDQVNNHYLRTFGSLFVLSLFNAIPSLLEDSASSSSNTQVKIVTLTEDVITGTDEQGKPIITTISKQQAVPITNAQSTGRLSNNSASDDFRKTLAQEIAQVGTEITRKNLQIQPTIVIRQGYRFNIMINKDLAFKAPYAAWR